MATYSFTKIVASDRLAQEISDSSITVALDYITTNGSTLNVTFKDSLSTEEENILSTIVTNHTAIPLEENVVKDVKVLESPPFAAPTFRTKRSKTASIETVAAGETKNIDFLLTSELYAHGGGMVYTGAEIGDYVSAEIRDVNGIIPEAYRAALCENWPTVASYIIGEWVPKGDGRYEINNYPLNAKITPGLYLRINYNACNAGSDRKVGINYYLAKKL